MKNEQQGRVENQDTEFAGSECIRNETSDQLDLNNASDATKCIAQCCLDYEKVF